MNANAFTQACKNGPFCPKLATCQYAHFIEQLNVVCPNGDACRFRTCQKWHQNWNIDLNTFRTMKGLEMGLNFYAFIPEMMKSEAEHLSDEEVTKRRVEALLPVDNGGKINGDFNSPGEIVEFEPGVQASIDAFMADLREEEDEDQIIERMANLSIVGERNGKDAVDDLSSKDVEFEDVVEFEEVEDDEGPRVLIPDSRRVNQLLDWYTQNGWDKSQCAEYVGQIIRAENGWASSASSSE